MMCALVDSQQKIAFPHGFSIICWSKLDNDHICMCQLINCTITIVGIVVTKRYIYIASFFARQWSFISFQNYWEAVLHRLICLQVEDATIASSTYTQHGQARIRKKFFSPTLVYVENSYIRKKNHC